MRQAAPFDPRYPLGEQAVGLERGDRSVTVTTDDGGRISARAIMITGGIGMFPPRPLPAGEVNDEDTTGGRADADAGTGPAGKASAGVAG